MAKDYNGAPLSECFIGTILNSQSRKRQSLDENQI